MYKLTGALCFAIAFALPQIGAAQDETLADIRQELTVLSVEVQKLKRELSTSGNSGGSAIGGASALERMDAIEAALGRVTGKTEQLENRINQVVADGTNRIGDLEYRLVELEGGDVSKLGETSTLGGGPAPTVAAPVVPSFGTAAGTDTGGAELAIGEKSDFERAQGVLASGDFRAAADQFAAFSEAYPGSPLEPEAHLRRGQALESAGDLTDAARAYLASFSGAPEGNVAPEALTRLGMALGRLGQTNEACTTLAEVGTRFPDSGSVLDAQSAMRNLGCS